MVSHRLGRYAEVTQTGGMQGAAAKTTPSQFCRPMLEAVTGGARQAETKPRDSRVNTVMGNEREGVLWLGSGNEGRGER